MKRTSEQLKQRREQIAKMSDEELSAIIHKWRGWKVATSDMIPSKTTTIVWSSALGKTSTSLPFPPSDVAKQTKWCITMSATGEPFFIVGPVDYCDDRNLWLVRDAEAFLPSTAAVEDYQMALAQTTVTLVKLFVGGTKYPADGFLFHASARQRSEALVQYIEDVTEYKHTGNERTNN